MSLPNPFDPAQVSDFFNDTMSEATSLGKATTATYNDVPVTPSSAWSMSNNKPTLQEQAQQIAQAAGVAPPSGDSLMTQDDILKYYKQNGIDTADPGVQASAAAVAAAQTPDLQKSFLSLSTPTFQQQAPADRGAYASALQNYGLNEVTFASAPNLGDNLTHGGAISRLDLAKNPPKDYVYKNGVLYYKSGVIADPNSGQVLYDPKSGKDTPGSPTWLIDAQKSWSMQKVENWRGQLRKLGYDVGKKGPWDSVLNAATQQYYTDKYLNGGNVLPLAPGSPGGMPQRTPPLDLSQLKATIQDQVVRQYQSVYGQDPDPKELQSWTQFIINTGMQLQRGGSQHSLTPDAALSEAEARASRHIYNSPAGQMAVQNAQENTTLHDALTSAIAATRSL